MTTRSRARRRRRGADPPRARPSTCRPAATRSTLAATGEEALELAADAPPRRRDPRPRPARHRRHRGHPRPARVDAGADHRALRPRATSATRSPRSTPAPTTTSPSRSAWTSCSPGCGPRCAGPRPADEEPDGRHRRLHVDLADQAGASTSTATRSASRRPSGTSSRCSSATPASSSTQRQLLQEVWGPAYGDGDATTCASTWPTSAASSNPTRRSPRYFITEPGMGYRFVV